jgi:hypothetical protein
MISLCQLNGKFTAENAPLSWNGRISRFHGNSTRPGTEIWVQAVDDTLVTQVHVTISDQNGAVLEEGNAQRAAGLWWTYTAHTQVPMEPRPHVLVTAHDQPGHFAEKVWEN